MSGPSRPVSGFVPLGDMAEAVELPGGRALTPAAPQARHHFTTLHQVNQLIEASEADADMGFMARLLALCSLPRTDPKTRLQYERVNGPYTLYMIAGGRNKLPYGNIRVCSWRGSAPKPSARNHASWCSVGRCTSSCDRSGLTIAAGAERGADTAQESDAAALWLQRAARLYRRGP